MSADRKDYKSLLIDKDSWKRLKRMSLDRELPMTKLIREMLDMYDDQQIHPQEKNAKSRLN